MGKVGEIFKLTVFRNNLKSSIETIKLFNYLPKSSQSKETSKALARATTS